MATIAPNGGGAQGTPFGDVYGLPLQNVGRTFLLAVFALLAARVGCAHGLAQRRGVPAYQVAATRDSGLRVCPQSLPGTRCFIRVPCKAWC